MKSMKRGVRLEQRILFRSACGSLVVLAGERKGAGGPGGWRLGKLPPGHSLRWLSLMVIFVRTEGITSETIVDKAVGVPRVARDFPNGKGAVPTV